MTPVDHHWVIGYAADVDQQADIEIGLLGPLEVVVDGRLADIPGRRPSALLVTLAMSPGKVVSLIDLIASIWDEAPPKTAEGTLQAHISRLRNALGPRERAGERLRWHAGGYLLDVPASTVDACRFETALRVAREIGTTDDTKAETLLADALGVWRGPVAAGIELGGPAALHAARLEEERLGAIEDLTDLRLSRGSHSELVPFLEEQVGNHPLRERFTAQLMLALYRSGRQADALSAFRRARHHLAEELGLHPSTELVSLERAILSHDSSLGVGSSQGEGEDAAGSGHVAAGSRQRPPFPASFSARNPAPFVNRAAERSCLNTAWRDVCKNGRPQTLAIAGEPGIGKTRLTREFARSAYDNGATVMFGRCTPEALVAYQPFVEALLPVSRTMAPKTLERELGASAPALGRILPGIAESLERVPDAVPSDTERLLLFEAVADLFAMVARQRPVLLVLEDFHWAETSTCMMLTHTARHHSSSRFAIVATFRANELTSSHPFAASLSELRRAGMLTEIDLSGLDKAATSELVAGLGGPDRASFTGDVFDRTEGNPFFVEEIVAEALTSGLESISDQNVPRGVREVIGHRLDVFTPEERRLLGAAAVLGREFEADLLADLTQTDDREILDVLEAATAAGLVHEVPGRLGWHAFGHALIRQTLYEELSELRRCRLHRDAADTLERLSDSPTGAAEIAHHMLAARSEVAAGRAADWALKAADETLAQLSYAEALRWARTAAEILEASPESPQYRDAMLILGHAHTALGDVHEARCAYEAAAELARSQADHARLISAVLGIAEGLASGVGSEYGITDWPLVDLIREAETLAAQNDPAARIRLLAALSAVTYYATELAALSDHASRDAVALAEDTGDATLLAVAYCARGRALWRPDPPLEERSRIARLAVTNADMAGNVEAEIHARIIELECRLDSGEATQVERLIRDIEYRVRPLRQPRWQWFPAVATAGLLLYRGRYADAEAVMDEALREVGSAQGENAFVSWSLQQFLLRRDTGRDRGGLIEMFLGIDRERGIPAVAAMAARLQVDHGDRSGAAGTLTRLLEDVDAIAPDTLWLATVGMLCETAVELGDVAAAEQLDALLVGREARFASLGGTGIYGCMAVPRGRAQSLLGNLEQAQALLAAASEAYERGGGLPHMARTGMHLAEVELRQGNPAEAAHRMRSVRRLVSELGMALVEPEALKDL